MILKEENDRMYLAYLVCTKHLQRMQFAHSNIQHLFPLTTTTYADLPDETLTFFDQLIFRFTKLQDTMGNKLFRFTLESLAEDGRELPLLVSIWEFTDGFLKKRFGYVFQLQLN